VQAGQALLSRVGWAQPILQPALSAAPWLSRIVHTPQIVSSCREGQGEVYGEWRIPPADL
jgi:hypothetical protein